MMYYRKALMLQTYLERGTYGDLEAVFSSRRRHTSSGGDWSSDVCSSDLVASTSAPAPSETPLAAPAWITPSFLKTLGSRRSASTVVSGRGCSSRENWIGPFFQGTSLGEISSLKCPASCAVAKRRCDRTAYSSTSSWEMRYC